MFSDDVVRFLYPVGLVANLFFGSAFILQWVLSTKFKQSFVPKTFWYLSSIGSFMMIFHGVIQSQYPVTLLHSVNFVISLRNINLYNKRPAPFLNVVLLMSFTIVLTSIPFILQSFICENSCWMATPNIFNLPINPPNLTWRIVGCFGLFIFSSRFLVQWLYAERFKTSNFPEVFWKIGFLGCLLSLLYFIRVADPINILSYGCGIFPPIANLFLIYKNRKRLISQSAQNHTYFISAGEASGDRLGADLITKIKAKHPEIHFVGIGGPLMRAAGMEEVLPMESFCISGFKEVFLAIPKIFLFYRKIVSFVLQKNPEKLIFIDFPDFHFLIIRKLRKKKFTNKIIFYVCPSIWAWRKKRKVFLEKNVNLLLSLLPFEKQLFNDSSLRVLYVGHPLVKEIEQHQPEPCWKDKCNVSEGDFVAFFPGSRHGDILKNLPVQLQAFKASSLQSSHQALISCSSPAFAKSISEIARKEQIERFSIIPSEYRYELAKSCQCAIAKCGTIVFETALMQTPTIVTCRLGSIDAFLIKYLFRIFLSSYCLPNIILGKIVFPEFLGSKEDTSPKEIATAIERTLSLEEKHLQQLCCRELKEVMESNISSEEDIISAIVN
ncbi:lipid-A-disaccharide synthase [Chlamydiifrater phoenicopteri]|uniref:lipid-A-disaccharide synthase n=1 Tax=Chlamydiifrater phoenicopteri TaxID=2681469 RepID=UPI001BCFDED3|nr:lipid-A-disaccharide synthase [Chlamydiifrater phoenicopteri]